MKLNSNTIIIIPSRMASRRLPGKPLATIQGEPMVAHVMRRAQEADIGPVVVAAAEQEIADVILSFGGQVVLTPPDLPSGTDRVYHALEKVDPERKYDTVINLQGDLPTINSESIGTLLDLMKLASWDIVTLAAEVTDLKEVSNPSVVKVVASVLPGKRSGRALYFSRSPVPWGEGLFYHHIGLYGFQRIALEKFVHLPISVIERRENLEQLRAIEAGMSVGVAVVDTLIEGVDTQQDLDSVRRQFDSRLT